MEVERESFESPWPEEMFIEELINPMSFTLLARDGRGGRLMGFICCWLVFDEMHLLDIAVRPSFRRKGVAKGMLQEAIRRSMKLGISAATLEVRSRNHGAIDFYEMVGFVREGLRPGYYDDPPDDAIIMWLMDMKKALDV
jgi:ribosomal-protein-alanine N-acetyltransferase